MLHRPYVPWKAIPTLRSISSFASQDREKLKLKLLDWVAHEVHFPLGHGDNVMEGDRNEEATISTAREGYDHGVRQS